MVAALKADIKRIRGAYEETVQHLFLRDEYVEKPEIRGRFEALLGKIDAAAALPEWDDPDQLATGWALAARATENRGKALVAGITSPDSSIDTSSIDAAINRAEEAKTLAIFRLAASADLPDKVAAWRDQAEIPSVVTLKPAAARDLLHKAGFKRIQLVAAKDPPPEGKELTVATQTPDANKKVRKSTEITLHIYPAAGEQPVEVPTLTGLPAKAARAQLAQLGLSMNPETSLELPQSKEQEFTIASQTEAPGTKLLPGQPVTVQVYPAFTEPVAPPTTAATAPTQEPATGGRWYVVQGQMARGNRFHWEVTGELTAKAVIPIPPAVLPQAQAALGIKGTEITLDATYLNGVYLINLRPLADKVTAWLSGTSDGSSWLFGGTGDGKIHVVTVECTRAEVEVHPSEENLRILIHVPSTITTDSGTQAFPGELEFLATPEPPQQ
jgi:hypothetical protein